MQIVGVSSAFPALYYSLQMLFAALPPYRGDRMVKPELLRRPHKNVWIRTAQEPGHCAIRRALTRAGLQADQLGAFYFPSVTGISRPLIDARLITRWAITEHPKVNKRRPEPGTRGVLAAMVPGFSSEMVALEW